MGHDGRDAGADLRGGAGGRNDRGEAGAEAGNVGDGVEGAGRAGTRQAERAGAGFGHGRIFTTTYRVPQHPLLHHPRASAAFQARDGRGPSARLGRCRHTRCPSDASRGGCKCWVLSTSEKDSGQAVVLPGGLVMASSIGRRTSFLCRSFTSTCFSRLPRPRTLSGLQIGRDHQCDRAQKSSA